MSDTFLLMTSATPKDERLHIMITKPMKDDIALAVRAPGFRSEADVVRYALEQVLPGLLEEAAKRYAGRTRVLVDTADPAPMKRVVTNREPARLRDVDLGPLAHYTIDAEGAVAANFPDLTATSAAWRDATPSSLAEQERSLEVLRQHGIIPESYSPFADPNTDDAPSA